MKNGFTSLAGAVTGFSFCCCRWCRSAVAARRRCGRLFAGSSSALRHLLFRRLLLRCGFPGRLFLRCLLLRHSSRSFVVCCPAYHLRSNRSQYQSSSRTRRARTSRRRSAISLSASERQRRAEARIVAQAGDHASETLRTEVHVGQTQAIEHELRPPDRIRQSFSELVRHQPSRA